MNEQLLQFIWQFALFQTVGLKLKDGRDLTLISRGQRNPDAGPDFSNAKIRIHDTIWAGNIELHVKESDWLKHKHHQDPVYQHIILHVVYIADLEKEPGNFPVLELKPYIAPGLMDHYHELMKAALPVACNKRLPAIPGLVWRSWLQRMLLEKWELKFLHWQQVLNTSHGSWLQLCYQAFTRNFGAKVNDDAFEYLARITPLAVLGRHKNNLTHIEALLFGQAGMIPAQPTHPYEIELSIHYAFFRQKYGLEPMEGRQWKYLRMRPAGFPSIRIAQLAMIIYKNERLFAKLLQVERLGDIAELFSLGVSSYWESHYTFQSGSKADKQKLLGDKMQSLIWINTIVPLQYFYQRSQEGNDRLTAAIAQLQQGAPEDNTVIKNWQKCGIKPADAFDTQALLHLFRHYCSPLRCLECSAGLWILKNR